MTFTDRLAGIPVIFDKDVPKGRVYLLNESTLFFGTWEPRTYPTVASIIAFQRRRRK